MGRTREIAVKRYVQLLEKVGKDVVDKELNSVSYKNRTFNLYDSYGWCIYVNGSAYRMGFAGGKLSTKSRKWYGEEMEGRSEIVKLFESYKPTAPIELVVGVAMPYGMVLEEKRKYEVFAIANSGVKQAAARLRAKHDYIRRR